MEWVIAALAVVAIAFAAVASTGRWGGMPELVDDREAPELPDGVLTSEDLSSVRLAVVPRGYSMEQVDRLLDRIGDQLGHREPTTIDVDAPARRAVVYGPVTDETDVPEVSDPPITSEASREDG